MRYVQCWLCTRVYWLGKMAALSMQPFLGFARIIGEGETGLADDTEHHLVVLTNNSQFTLCNIIRVLIH